MKTNVKKAILAGILVLASTAPAGPSRGAQGSDADLSQLPPSLDSLYPPARSRPVFLIKMLSLETSLSGIVADLSEGDIEGARGSFDEFRTHYTEAADMVPEWKGGYPMRSVGELGEALAAGDTPRSMAAVAAVGGTCHRCHRAAMVPVQQKYRWGKMGAMTVRDPLGDAVTGYAPFKASMAANLAGITVNLGQGQPGNARKQFDAFRARFKALGDSCNGCHETGSRYYVDSGIQETLDKIGRALSDNPPDARAVAALVKEIGSESCSKCHLVHVPAAQSAASRR